ncbi:MAG: hypothetical protein KAJ19_24130 [Gammaproteobacteria bacterium]|nr:hypothetical protein [Gammaproteobacteria bacterium]
MTTAIAQNARQVAMNDHVFIGQGAGLELRLMNWRKRMKKRELAELKRLKGKYEDNFEED